MSQENSEEFLPDPRKLRRLLFATACCLVVFVAFVLKEGVPIGAYSIVAMLTVCGIYLLRRWWRARGGAIMTDEEGLWRARQKRDNGLIRWADIESTKWTMLPGGLRLQGQNESTLLTVSIDLSEFGRLERLLAKQARNGASGGAHAVSTDYGAVVPIALWPLFSGIGLLAVLLPSTEWLWPGVAVVDLLLFVLLIGVLFNTSGTNAIPWVWRVSFEDGRLRVWFLLHVQDIVREEVESIAIGTRPDDVWQSRGVMVRLKWGKPPVFIRGLRHSPEEMLTRIEGWWAGVSAGEQGEGEAAQAPSIR